MANEKVYIPTSEYDESYNFPEVRETEGVKFEYENQVAAYEVGAGTLYIVPSGYDFYVTHLSGNLSCDGTGAGAWRIITLTINGAWVWLDWGFEDNKAVSYPFSLDFTYPFKFKEGDSLAVTNNIFTKSYVTMVGFLVPKKP